MSRGYNHVTLEGNLARDPDIRTTTSKQKCARFALAIGDDYKGKDGQTIKHTDFVDCVAWGALADILEKYTAKGHPLLVDGKITKREYEKDGQKKYITEVVVAHVVLLSYSAAKDNNNSADGSSNATAPEQEYVEANGLPDVTIPF